MFRSLIGRYRRAIADLRSLCRESPPKRLQDRLALLDKLIAAQLARRKLGDEREFGCAVLGSIWAFETTQWTAVEALFVLPPKKRTRKFADFLALLVKDSGTLSPNPWDFSH
jgi:hypothetical protein